MLICTVVPEERVTPSLRFQASEVPSRYLILKSTLPVQQGSSSSIACLVCDPLPDPSGVQAPTIRGVPIHHAIVGETRQGRRMILPTERHHRACLPDAASGWGIWCERKCHDRRTVMTITQSVQRPAFLLLGIFLPLAPA